MGPAHAVALAVDLKDEVRSSEPSAQILGGLLRANIAPVDQWLNSAIGSYRRNEGPGSRLRQQVDRLMQRLPLRLLDRGAELMPAVGSQLPVSVCRSPANAPQCRFGPAERKRRSAATRVPPAFRSESAPRCL